MIRNVLESITGIEIFPLLSLVIFTVFFTGVIIWVVKMDKKTVDKMKFLPLEED
jgi:cbb3-type cytochrome oxidase subunit 3